VENKVTILKTVELRETITKLEALKKRLKEPKKPKETHQNV